MKVLVSYDYPPSPGGLATQGDLLFRGLREMGVDAHAVNFESAQEKEWYYRWFDPDLVVGVGYWGHNPHLILHPQRYGIFNQIRNLSSCTSYAQWSNHETI